MSYEYKEKNLKLEIKKVKFQKYYLGVPVWVGTPAGPRVSPPLVWAHRGLKQSIGGVLSWCLIKGAMAVAKGAWSEVGVCLWVG